MSKKETESRFKVENDPLPTQMIPKPFQIIGASNDPESPVFLTVPHSGRYYPKSFTDKTMRSLLELRLSEDAYVDLLLSELTSKSTTMIVARYARSYLDLNRQAGELDPLMFTPPLNKQGLTQSHRVKAGLGCIPKVCGPSLPIYNRPIPAEEVGERLNTAYYPFHHAIHAEIAKRYRKFGTAIIIDCHSMPNPEINNNQNTQKVWPDFVIGDCWGTSCHKDYSDEIEQLLKQQNFSVRKNTPYAGGHICRHYGDPARGIHTLQIEINRSTYMNEKTLEPNDCFDEFGSKLRQVISGFTASKHGLSKAAE